MVSRAGCSPGSWSCSRSHVISFLSPTAARFPVRPGRHPVALCVHRHRARLRTVDGQPLWRSCRVGHHVTQRVPSQRTAVDTVIENSEWDCCRRKCRAVTRVAVAWSSVRSRAAPVPGDTEAVLDLAVGQCGDPRPSSPVRRRGSPSARAERQYHVRGDRTESLALTAPACQRHRSATSDVPAALPGGDGSSSPPGRPLTRPTGSRPLASPLAPCQFRSRWRSTLTQRSASTPGPRSVITRDLLPTGRGYRVESASERSDLRGYDRGRVTRPTCGCRSTRRRRRLTVGRTHRSGSRSRGRPRRMTG